MKNYMKLPAIFSAKSRIRLILVVVLSYLLIMFGLNVTGQNINLGVFVEQNIVGFQRGASVSTILNKKFEVGYFYQASDKVSLLEDIYNYNFHGIQASLPIKSCDGLSLHAGIKTGIVNGTFLVITPQITTKFLLKKHIEIGFNTSYRAGHAAMGAMISLNY